MKRKANINDGGPVFPQSMHPGGPFGGLSLRDWFAGQFLAGASVGDNSLTLRNGEPLNEARKRYWSEVAKTAYIAADEMIAARDKGE